MYLNGVFKYLPLKGVHFSLVQDMEQFYELWLKSQKNEKSDDAASQSSKENGKQIHMPTDYAEVTVSTAGWCPCLCFQAFSFPPSPKSGSLAPSWPARLPVSSSSLSDKYLQIYQVLG